MPVDRRPAAFIDRDGVINADHGHVWRIEDFDVLPGVYDGLRQLAGCGYALVVVTNQAGIAKGLYTPQQYERLSTHLRTLMKDHGVPLAGIFHCPHHPQGTVPAFAQTCDCRKPAPGLLLQAAAQLGLDLSRSVLVGDKPSDVAAGRAAGVRWAVLVESGHPLPPDTAGLADHRCAGLAEAARWICAAPASAGPQGAS
jgi:D-glycero-D-manno-heptose 1,7-bisphosphate phosphatase